MRLLIAYCIIGVEHKHKHTTFLETFLKMRIECLLNCQKIYLFRADPNILIGNFLKAPENQDLMKTKICSFFKILYRINNFERKDGYSNPRTPHQILQWYICMRADKKLACIYFFLISSYLEFVFENLLCSYFSCSWPSKTVNGNFLNFAPVLVHPFINVQSWFVHF